MSIGNVVQYLTQSVTVYHNTPTQNAIGGLVDSWSTGRAIKGRIRPFSGNFSGQERIDADKVTVYANFRLYTASTAIVEADELVCEGVRYRVKSVANMMNMGRLWQVDLEWVSHGS